jgi:hypothetical protein
MSNLAELSDTKIDSLKRRGTNVNLVDIDHMLTNDGLYDFDKASNWLETAALEGISKSPKRQNKCENEQISALSKSFIGFKQLPPKTKYLFGGKIFTYRPERGVYDLDAELTDHGYEALFTLKGTSESGGGQDNVLNQVLTSFINEAPDLTATNKIVLVCYLTGEFWSKPHPRAYRGWEKKIVFPASLLDIIEWEAKIKQKRVIVIRKLPTSLSSFYDLYIKGQSYDI